MSAWLSIKERLVMLDQLPEMTAPRWMADLSSTTVKNKPFSIHELLRDSLNYPGSGFDGDPVRHLAGNILSFIYVDYGHSRAEFVEALEKRWFPEYEVIGQPRSVTEQELTPHGWPPDPPTLTNGDHSLLADWIKEPFCEWVVFQRSADVPPGRGPYRFSLLYLCKEGVAAFRALYVANNIAPKSVAIIQAGPGTGLNHTDFRDPDEIFARSVLNNRAGQPEILLYGGMGHQFYQEPCWPDYNTNVCFLDRADGSIGVWSI